MLAQFANRMITQRMRVVAFSSVSKLFGISYLGDGVGLAVVHNLRGRRAVGGVGSHNLSGVHGAVGPGGCTSHEGGGSSCDGGETHFDGGY